MYIESLDQEMAIASQEEAVDFQNHQPRHWNIVSITGRLYQNKPHFSHALTVCSLFFDDVEEDFPDKNLYAAKTEDIQKAIVFSRELGQQPLLIHCYAGISRSTALAWLIIFDKMRAQRYPVRRSFVILRRLRPFLMPNRHILQLGVEILIGDSAAQKPIEREFSGCLASLYGEYQA